MSINIVNINIARKALKIDEKTNLYRKTAHNKRR